MKNTLTSTTTTITAATERFKFGCCCRCRRFCCLLLFDHRVKLHLVKNSSQITIPEGESFPREEKRSREEQIMNVRIKVQILPVDF